MCRWKRTHIAEPSSVTAFAVTHISHYWNLSSASTSFDLESTNVFLSPSISPFPLDNDQRRRCTLKGRSAAEVLFIGYLYTIQLSLKGRRGERKGGRTLEGSRVTQTGIGCQSQTMGDRIDTCRFRESIEEGAGKKVTIGYIGKFRCFVSIFFFSFSFVFTNPFSIVSRDYW